MYSRLSAGPQPSIVFPPHHRTWYTRATSRKKTELWSIPLAELLFTQLESCMYIADQRLATQLQKFSFHRLSQVTVTTDFTIVPIYIYIYLLTCCT